MGASQNNLNRICEYYTSLGFEMPDIGLLQPAEPFLDTAGEDLRRRIFMTSDLGGKNLCLRPEFTIPVCLEYLKGDKSSATFAYGGSVFRQREMGNSEPSEFQQVGIEAIGQEDRINADAQCVVDALAALEHLGQRDLTTIIGDHAIFDALLEALDLPPAWQLRLSRAFGDEDKLRYDLKLISGKTEAAPAIDPGLKPALEMQNIDAVESWISEKMREANLPASGGRTATSIAKRMLEKAEIAAAHMDESQFDALRSFLEIEASGSTAIEALRGFSTSRNINLDTAIETFAARHAQILASAPKAENIIYRANFGRRLDYYSGVVFEIHNSNSTTICGGGRYDHLMALLGAKKEIPAIGYSIWLDRLGAAQS